MPGVVGSDESGKGDYFGPLVVAATLVHEIHFGMLTELGIKDSKRLSDAKILKMAPPLIPSFQHNIVVVSPRKYNELYNKFKNLNRLLAWAHARSIENLLMDTSPDLILVDQFANSKILESMLFEKTRKKLLIQRVQGESHISVALASIFARFKFLEQIKALGEKIGMKLPKGASREVESIASEIYSRKGIDGLYEVAKIHFKTTKKIDKSFIDVAR